MGSMKTSVTLRGRNTVITDIKNKVKIT